MRDEPRVTPLELFFDLVFVFAITQVTRMLADDPTWSGLGRGMLVLAALWWAWGAYAWLTNAVDPNETGPRLVVFAAMAALIVTSLAVPQAFEDDALLFAIPYFAVRLLHLALYHVSTRGDEAAHGAIVALAPPWIVAPALLVVAAFLDGPAQGAVWVVALLIDYGGPLVRGMSGWTVHAGHFAERHGLIVIIALGESIVAIGVGATDARLDQGIVIASVLGIVAVASLWWAYFDVVAIVAERKLHELQGIARARLARDSYSYLHLPMIAGIVLFALGLKKTIGHVDDPLKTIPAVGLAGGPALYLLAHVGFRWRNVRSWNPHRTAVAVACLALIPLALELEALHSLAIVTSLLAALIAYEAVHFREARARVRMQA